MEKFGVWNIESFVSPVFDHTAIVRTYWAQLFCDQVFDKEVEKLQEKFLKEKNFYTFVEINQREFVYNVLF